MQLEIDSPQLRFTCIHPLVDLQHIHSHPCSMATSCEPTVEPAPVAQDGVTSSPCYLPFDFALLMLYPLTSNLTDPLGYKTPAQSAVTTILEMLRSPVGTNPFCLPHQFCYEDAGGQSFHDQTVQVCGHFRQLLLQSCGHIDLQCCLHSESSGCPMVMTLRAPVGKYVSIPHATRLELLRTEDGQQCPWNYEIVMEADIVPFVGGDDDACLLRSYYYDKVVEQKSAVILITCDNQIQGGDVVGKSSSGVDMKRWTWAVYVLPFQETHPCVYMMPTDLELFRTRFLQCLCSQSHERLWYTTSAVGFSHFSKFPLSLLPASCLVGGPVLALDANDIRTRLYSLNNVDDGVYVVMGISYLLQKQVVYIQMWPSALPTFAVFAPGDDDAEWDSPVPRDLLDLLRSVSVG